MIRAAIKKKFTESKEDGDMVDDFMKKLSGLWTEKFYHNRSKANNFSDLLKFLLKVNVVFRE